MLKNYRFVTGLTFKEIWVLLNGTTEATANK